MRRDTIRGAVILTLIFGGVMLLAQGGRAALSALTAGSWAGLLVVIALAGASAGVVWLASRQKGERQAIAIVFALPFALLSLVAGVCWLNAAI